MILLLFLVLFAEAAVALLLAIKVGSLHEAAIQGIDGIKTKVVLPKSVINVRVSL
jgi:B-cell receptor-associated protein 31